MWNVRNFRFVLCLNMQDEADKDWGRGFPFFFFFSFSRHPVMDARLLMTALELW